MSNLSEVKRVTQLEMSGKIDKDGLQEFIKVGFIYLSFNGYARPAACSIPTTSFSWATLEALLA